ncbi:zonadhesin-like isoform X2 [Oryzias latipes]|uniref:zonadhesin-like isoform X2 n=1 Tax=Oryzias latipes TaxID=8090 RepID=UPI000CE2116A|nr:zonadhesin-like isoform X2 [Oryzias latipes]
MLFLKHVFCFFHLIDREASVFSLSSLSPGEGGPCPVGHYCPRATILPVPCPQGTFSNLSKLVSKGDCQPCLPGYYCDATGLSAPSGKCWEGFLCFKGANRPDPPVRDSHGGPCPKGYYCSEGSVAPQRCPLGTISTEDGRASCSACPQGFYCPGRSNDSLWVSFQCPVGHYCPPGTWSKHQYPCPAGSFNPDTQKTKLQDCLPCPPGSFCAFPGKDGASGPCSAGYFCLSGAQSPTPDGGKTGGRCPEGHYCLQGSPEPLPCPVGYYSNTTKNRQLSDCLPCPPGFLCVSRGLSLPSHICPAGSYCPGKENSSQQDSLYCSPGNRCPPGSDRQIPCLPGTYQSYSGQTECFECPAGFFCPVSLDGDSDVSGTQIPKLCPEGHYCPPGTQTHVAFPCPAGTFSRQMGLSSMSDCELCPPGTYCSSSGQAAPTGVCSPGYYCINGSVSSQPEEGPTGGRCPSGFYCPKATSSVIPCPSGTFGSAEGAVSLEACRSCTPGHYCAEAGLSSPSGLCSAGFYCREGSRTATPLANTSDDTASAAQTDRDSSLGHFFGDVCPAGHYCPKGSAKPNPCPPGTFSGKSAAESEADCEACHPGSYCPSWAQTSVDLFCPQGWFCPGRSVSGYQAGRQCSPGHACPLGSAKPTVCFPGTFQSLPGQSACGSCPRGFYCTEGSSLPAPCPLGHFSPLAGRSSLSDCSPCPSGFFCNSSALTEPSGPCSPGHFCSLGSIEPSPVSQLYGDVCPRGHFCPQGSESSKPCPVGTFLPEPGAFSLSHCRPCPPGQYCLTPGASQPSGQCYKGFFCSGGADSPTPRANLSSVICLLKILELSSMNMEGAVWKHNLSCNDNFGRNANWIKVETVLQADSDRVVNDSAPHLKSPHYTCSTYRGDVCPQGFYCPLGSAYPQPCEAGFYCNHRGLEAPAGSCAAGYFCPIGSVDPNAYQCPAGHFCPLGTPLPLPCPLGTQKNYLGGSTVEACQPCPPGHYCNQRGIAAPSGQCAAGYYCPAGQSSERPQQHACTVGHYCEKGSVIQTPCSPGSYQPRQGQQICETCPPGFVCQDQGMSLPLLCERGYYCPSGSAKQCPCPSGTYGNMSGLSEEAQCVLCDPGMYCKETGSIFPSGPCDAGFVCVRGASEASPSDGLRGFSCPLGYFCPVGTSVPKPCPKGTFSDQRGLVDDTECQSCSPGFYCSESGLSSVSGPCLPGFVCLEGSQSAAPVSGDFGGACPVGHYCSEGTSVPSPCPPGFYQNEAGGKSKDDCKPCPLGWFQDLPGQKSCHPCPPGFLCQAPSASSTRGSPIGASSPLPCPAGFTCPSENPESQPIPCPKGTYSPVQGLITTGQCLVCPSGQFCGSEGLIEPSGQCAAGFLCFTGAKMPNPTDNITGSLCPPGGFCQGGLKEGDCWAGFYCAWGSSKADGTLCPAGFFCPNGTKNPIPCPAGTFTSEMGSTDQGNCKTCLPGYYCQDEGTSQPALCPVGYYCPAGLIYGVEFPCPPGTVQNQLGASNPEACLPCPAGMFCFQPGLSKPTGLCQAGYFCPAGSTSPNSADYQGNTTMSQLCPPGHYCPSGAGYPLPCPPGSLSVSQGLKTIEECPPCPPGLFCGSPKMANLSDALPCGAGFVCLGGSSSPTPSDGSHGYPCPAGYSCPIGSTIEVPCEPGTYNPAPGAGHCMLCLKGSMCPSLATQEPLTCPAGSFCPAGTVLAQACPPGTFSKQTGAQSRSVCTPCPPGVYCSLYGATTPQGPCLEGYFCQGGATEPTPDSSVDFPKNGPCPAGHYCPSGCLSPIPCPLGSVRNASGGVSMEDCFTCPAGHYCSIEGLSSPSGPCAAGFFCPFDFSSTTPYAFICPKGHFCPEGSAFAFPCPTGEYQPNPGSENCIPCRPGFYCEEAIVGEPRPCPPHAYCPAGTMVPQPCPNGTYTASNHEGLQEESECLPCPPGKFCRAGKIQGLCAAGYLCLSGSTDFLPQGPVSNITVCQWGVRCAGPCPPGFFCPEGTQEAQLCPANTIRSSPRGVSLQDCLPCPPRYWCKPGDPVFHLCPAGHYCDGLPGSDFNGSSGPRPCPLYTYRVFPGAGSKGDCLPCPPGSHCNSTGFTNYSSTPCPPGFWCSGSGPPILCPAGTKRQLPGAAAPDHCEPCVGGTYCPDPRITGKPNVEGIPCRAAYQCPAGAASEKPCRAGSYCGPQTAEPQICPEGYICPEGSLLYNNPKQMCPFPYYCPANSSFMRSCEGGSMPVNIVGLRGSKSSCCRLCDGGFYRIHLSPNLQCLPCPPGYYCPAGTDNYKSTPCPLGYICPMGSTQPVPCPPGTFGNINHGEKTEDCHPCPANTFNHLPAQKACFPCGSSSTSSAGSSACTCRGKNRAFHYSDGSCLCRTGFIFYNELDFKSSVSDSELDCQPEVNRRCSTGEVRLAASRDCVFPSLHSCNVTCGKHGGTLDVEMGICHCEQYVSAEELCNTSCLSRLPQLSAQFSPDGDILLSLKERDSMVWTKRVISVLGPDIHAKTSGKTYLVQFDSDGVFGWIPSQKDLVYQFLSEPFEALNTRTRKRRNADDDDGALTILPRIPNPIACLSSGDMLIFHLTINHTDRHYSHFPVYQKDHLFNSNPKWDFGAFRHLQILMKQTKFNSSWFAHVFSEAGKYVFVDSAVPQRSMVVVVGEEGAECDPRATAFQPMTPAHLVRYGVVKQHRLNLLPDWGLILAVLCLLLVVVVVLTITVLVLQPDKAKLVPHWRSKPKWRSLGEPFCPVECVCSRESTVIQSPAGILGSRGVGEGAETEEPAVSKGGSVSGCCDLEEFNVKTLYDKLEDQNLHIASQLARHRKDMQEFYRNICEHAESLKNVIENLDSKKLSVLKEILTDKAVKEKPSHSSVEDSGSQDGACVFLLGAVLKSVEALLFKLTGEAWQNQDLCGFQYCPTTHPHMRDCEPQAGYVQTTETNMCFTQFSLMTKAGGDTNETDHMQTTGPCVSDHDLSKLVALSPLFKTLQEIQQSLQNLSTDETRQHCHNAMLHSVQVDYVGHLTPTSLEKLSPQHSAVFLFGCQVMQLLSNSPRFPSVLLLLAKSIPSSSSVSNESLLAHCSEDYYFDAANQILYLSEAKLQHVGHFIAVILQSMAHIAAGSTPQRFMQALDEAISALSLQLFNLSFKWSAAEANLDASNGEHGTLAEQFFTVRVPSETLFTEHLLASRIEKYKYFKLEQLICNSKQSFVPDTDTGFPPKGTPVQISCIEEEIDRMSESFLQLSMQLQRRSQMSTWLNDRENIAESQTRRSSASTPSLSRSGTVLLELKRHLVSQRLDELKVTLDLMRRRQQHDSKLKDGAGGRTQSDSSIIQQEESEHVSTSDGCKTASDQHGCDTSAN